jgi:hypothetical protein
VTFETERGRMMLQIAQDRAAVDARRIDLARVESELEIKRDEIQRLRCVKQLRRGDKPIGLIMSYLHWATGLSWK